MECMEGLTITKLINISRIEIDKQTIYIPNEEAEEFSSILEYLDAQECDKPTELAVQMAIRSFIRNFGIFI